MRKYFSSASMMMIVASMALVIAFAFVSCNKTTPTTSPAVVASGSPTVHSKTTTVVPAIDGVANDDAWNVGVFTTVHMKPIVIPNNPLTDEFDVQIKSVHTADTIYFLVSYPDPEANETPNKLVFNGGSPTQVANWKNSYNGQDGFSFMWDMMLGGVAAYDPGGKFSDSAYGCTAACHATTDPTQLESGMFPAHGAVDIWYWNAGTTNPQGYADDQFAVGADANNTGQNNRRDKDAQQEEWFSYANYSEATADMPDNVVGGNNHALDGTKFLWSGTSVVLDTTKNNVTGKSWSAGDFVPGWALHVLFPIGSENDVHAKGVYANGTWTIEFKRAISNTDHDQDVQFSTSGAATFPFSIAVHENVRKYTNWEYQTLTNYQPPHYGCVPRKILLSIE